MTAAPARVERSTAEVLAGFGAGDERALARAVSWVEDGDSRGREVLRAVFTRTGRARVIGVTGSPGAGKSTLVDGMAARLTAAGRRVAILAVDPSSAFSGGAVLGDRIRMRASMEIAGVFIRSMATRGHLGGLARATEDAVDLLDAFGFDDVLLETVGVGQDEVEVIQVAHLSLLVLVPFMGDDIQAIKAGVMEIADAFVVNKADRDGAERLEAQLAATLSLYEDGPRTTPIVRTVATTGSGVPELLAAVEKLFQEREASGSIDARRQRAARRVEGLVREQLRAELAARPGAEAALAAAVDDVLARRQDPYGAVAAAVARARTPSVDHVAVAVADASAALRFWRDALGLEVAHEEEVTSEGVRVTMLPVGESRIELLEPLPGDGPVRTFLGKRGPGMHHACFRVSDMEAALERLRAAGVRLVGAAPRRGAGGRLVAFVHPESTGGVLVEISADESAQAGVRDGTPAEAGT